MATIMLLKVKENEHTDTLLNNNWLSELPMNILEMFNLVSMISTQLDDGFTSLGII